MYHGVVFDFDGVLYDSEKHWEEIENQYLIERLPSWKPEDYKHLIGRSSPEAYQYLKAAGFSLSEADYFVDYNQMADLLYASYAKPLANIDTLLERIKSFNKKIAIASSSKRSWIDSSLHSHPLSVKFNVIVSAHDKEVAKGKPAPDVYLRAAHLLNSEATELLAIEDSRNGVASAKAAGLYCLGLRNGFNDTQDLSEADDIIDGFSEPSISKIVSLIS